MDENIRQVFDELRMKNFPFVVAIDSGKQVEIMCAGRQGDNSRLATALSEYVMFEDAKRFIAEYEKKMAKIRPDLYENKAKEEEPTNETEED